MNTTNKIPVIGLLCLSLVSGVYAVTGSTDEQRESSSAVSNVPKSSSAALIGVAGFLFILRKRS